MQDISNLAQWPQWQPQKVLAALSANPLTVKSMKIKLDRIFMINSFNERQYLPDVIDAYHWIKFVAENQQEQALKLFQNEKVHKYFIEDFVSTSIKYMIMCKTFKMLEMMIYTQQMMVEGLKLFKHYFPQIQKYPRLFMILKQTFQLQKLFFKTNYVNQYSPIPFTPQKQTLEAVHALLPTLQTGHHIDILKVEHQPKRCCWLPGTFRKVSSLYLYVTCDYEREKGKLTVQGNGMQIRPYGTMKSQYEWRFNLKTGDSVDYMIQMNGWVTTKIQQIRVTQESDQEGAAVVINPATSTIQVRLQADSEYWVSVTDPKIQPASSICRLRPDNRIEYQFMSEDYTDYIFDPKMEHIFVTRPEVTKSLLAIDLLKFCHQKLDMFNIIAKIVKEKSMKIQVVAQLINFVLLIHPLWHRQFAVQYLSDFIKSILQYINNGKQSTIIRNFSKQRYQGIMNALQQFMKRLYPTSERRQIIESLQLDLILRFLYSDFLDRKLQAVSSLTNFFKMCKHGINRTTLKQFLQYLQQNKILAAIFNQKSHSQLISKSSQFLKYYLQIHPPVAQLQPLLTWSQPILHLLADSFQELPSEIQGPIIEQIQSRTPISNPDALSIMKRMPNCQQWLLKNGGEGWVEVVRGKTKKKQQIVEVFKCDFQVVSRITKQMNQLYESGFKSTYFNYMFQINYLGKILGQEGIGLQQKLQFITLATQLMKKITDPLFQQLLKILLSPSTPQLGAKYQKFFISIMPKLHVSHLHKLFQSRFSTRNQLENLTQQQLVIFEKCFIGINGDGIGIRDQGRDMYGESRRKVPETYIVEANIQDLVGIDKLQQILFYSNNPEISTKIIKFVGLLLSSMHSQQLRPMAGQYIQSLLQKSQVQLYCSTSTQGLQKSLILLNELLNQTETQGIDPEPSVSALFPTQKIELKIIDHFNTTKTKLFMNAPSNMTLFQLRCQVCKHINAYIFETKMMIGGKQLSERYNGHVVYTIPELVSANEIIICKVVQIPRVSLLNQNGTLSQKAKIIFNKIFKEYSSYGLMSKKQCLKYHQKCVGQVMSQGQTKVDKIYEQFDEDKDGYLTQADFINFYQLSIKTKQHFVWSNLQTFGVRNDLQILDSLPIQYPEKEDLARNRLFTNEKFMKLLFELLKSPTQSLAETAWKLLSRLPLYTKLPLQLDLSKQYLTRYWLYLTQHNKQFEKISKEVLGAVLKMSIQTVCIALKVAEQCEEIDEPIFQTIVSNLNQINGIGSLDFYRRVLLEYSLKVFVKFVSKDEQICQQYLKNQQQITKIFRQGIMSTQPFIRQSYCNTLSQMIHSSLNEGPKNFPLFQSLYNLIYRIFDKCELSTLTLQYFELFTHLLQILKANQDIMEKLDINWPKLTQEIIEIYKSHQCTETSMTSKPDAVAEGLLKIIAKLVNQDTIDHIVELVPFIFQQSLFPEKGRNKLKTSKSRQDAYELIYQICKYQSKKSKTHNVALQKLFNAGFKQIYKKMSTKKSTQVFSYYYYSYNESRSQLGYAGIRNLGCICYMISMLQQLYMTVPFRNLIIMADDGQPECLTKKGNKQIDDNLFHQLKTMFGYLLLTEKQQYNPEEFCFSFKDFEGLPVNTSVQQDAQQFLNIFFDKMETSLKNTPFKHIFENIFGGKSCSQMTCSGCGAIKERSQNFYPLSLQIKGFKSIYQSLSKYTTGQIISDYQCDSCKNKCNVTKRTFLQKTPNYFIIHLQRMCFNYDRLENEKVNSRWQFPHQLNVYPYTLSSEKKLQEQNGQFTYKLRGIVVHYGTADFGHYFSYIRQNQSQSGNSNHGKEGDTWLQFNDERVRQFDPSDIQVQCFGGQHWRRQSQSAYLLVYQRQNKSDLILQFNSEQEKKKILQQFKLTNAVIQEAMIQKNQSQSKVSKVDSVATQQLMEQKEKIIQSQLEQSQSESVGLQKQSQTCVQKQSQQSVLKQAPPPPKIVTHLSLTKIPMPSLPKPIKDRIDQENDEFSFTMNLSNIEFATFIYNILSLRPPENLWEEFLQLCYECLNLKQNIRVGPHGHQKLISISEWASQRFSELIQGHGWQFMKNFGQNWESDILSIQKNVKNVTKCLLQSVVTDIIKTNNFNEQFNQTEETKGEDLNKKQQKRRVILQFLNRLSEMMLNQVVKHWSRFAEYFQLWIALVKENHFVRRYCEEKMLVQKILDFVMEQGYPYQKGKKRHTMGNQYYFPEFQYPLSLMNTLIENGYELNQMEKNCIKNQAFMQKIICYRVQGMNMIERLCKNNTIISQKVGFLLLYHSSAVQQSDYLNPIAASMLEYIRIEDSLQPRRIEWIIGFPTYVQQSRDKGFGSYGCLPASEPAVNYISALGAMSIMQQLLKFKKKSPHICVLLMSFMLQLEHDGFINNLDQYPSKFALERSYTAEFESFINSYYQENHRPYPTKKYCQYGQRAKRLWQQRPRRPFKNPFPKVILGKTIQQKLVSHQTHQQFFQIVQTDIKTFYLPHSVEGTENLTGKNILTMKKNQNFVCPNLPKPTKSYGHYSLMKVNSSDQEDNQETPSEAIFDSAKQGWLLRKIQIFNRTNDDVSVVFGVDNKAHNKGDDQKGAPAQNVTQCNLHVPISPMGLQIQSNSSSTSILIKKDIDKDYGELKIMFHVLGRANTSGFPPKQFITQVDQKVEYMKPNNNSDDDDDDEEDINGLY